ncbi:MAG: YraN family protein [Gammaproteobacteria bacterium CG22_combo_CG10-13_8_21_14_all_40_8]|nr:MAG: YraN family protein [Gammaproteobacteria bacterium CG22_combo_CG10-13_8_21_14_all_40_8]
MKLPKPTQWLNKLTKLNKFSKASHLVQGSDAENLAEIYLHQQGLKTLERNFRCKVGEIDLIMLHNEYLVFVEVRLRTHQLVNALETVDAKKQAKIIKTAQLYLQNHQKFSERPCRFDVIGFDALQVDRIQWIKDAFQT